jgi:hypothetical protein
MDSTHGGSAISKYEKFDMRNQGRQDDANVLNGFTNVLTKIANLGVWFGNHTVVPLFGATQRDYYEGWGDWSKGLYCSESDEEHQKHVEGGELLLLFLCDAMLAGEFAPGEEQTPGGTRTPALRGASSNVKGLATEGSPSVPTSFNMEDSGGGTGEVAGNEQQVPYNPSPRRVGGEVDVHGPNPSNAAHDAADAARLSQHYSQLEKYGEAGYKVLENGRYRYYGEIKPARTPGQMQGARLVREWDPSTGNSRTWYETLDQEGRVRSVAPKPPTGPLNHRIFDENGNYQGLR